MSKQFNDNIIFVIQRELGLSRRYLPAMRVLQANLLIHMEIIEEDFTLPKLLEVANQQFLRLAELERKRCGAHTWKAKFVEAFGKKYLETLI